MKRSVNERQIKFGVYVHTDTREERTKYEEDRRQQLINAIFNKENQTRKRIEAIVPIPHREGLFGGICPTCSHFVLSTSMVCSQCFQELEPTETGIYN